MSELVESDLLLEAISDELPEFWPVERELLAQIVELLSAMYVAFLKANGGKNIPQPRTVPRPGSMQASEQAPISMSDYAKQQART